MRYGIGQVIWSTDNCLIDRQFNRPTDLNLVESAVAVSCCLPISYIHMPISIKKAIPRLHSESAVRGVPQNLLFSGHHEYFVETTSFKHFVCVHLFAINLALYYVSHSVFIYLFEFIWNRSRDFLNLSSCSQSLGFVSLCALIIHYKRKRILKLHMISFSIIFEKESSVICQLLFLYLYCLISPLSKNITIILVFAIVRLFILFIRYIKKKNDY